MLSTQFVTIFLVPWAGGRYILIRFWKTENVEKKLQEREKMDRRNMHE